MMAANPRTRNLFRQACIACVVGLLALAGCKSRDGGGGGVGGGGGGGKMRDPLVYGPTRIPPQNVPLTPSGNATKGRDPLTSPVGKSGSDKSGVGYADDPERFRGNYNPGPGTTPAALAGKRNDGDELKIDTPDNRVPLRQTGAVIPAVGTGGSSGNGGSGELAGDGLEPLFAELAKYGATREYRSLNSENGVYTFKASVQISGNGARRGYQGEAANANEAVKKVLDQVVADRK